MISATAETPQPNIIWALMLKTCRLGIANNEGADQPAQSYQCLCYLFIGNSHI